LLIVNEHYLRQVLAEHRIRWKQVLGGLTYEHYIAASTVVSARTSSCLALPLRSLFCCRDRSIRCRDDSQGGITGRHTAPLGTKRHHMTPRGAASA
jgi:hypothetical protein